MTLFIHFLNTWRLISTKLVTLKATEKFPEKWTLPECVTEWEAIVYWALLFRCCCFCCCLVCDYVCQSQADILSPFSAFSPPQIWLHPLAIMKFLKNSFPGINIPACHLIKFLWVCPFKMNVQLSKPLKVTRTQTLAHSMHTPRHTQRNTDRHWVTTLQEPSS